MNFDVLTRFLEKRLRLPFSGVPVRDRMRPRLQNGVPIKMKHKTQPKKGSVLILIYKDGENAYFPLIHRPSYEEIHSGQMALQGVKYGETDSVNMKLLVIGEFNYKARFIKESREIDDAVMLALSCTLNIQKAGSS